MNIGRMFANAIVRRIIYVLVALIFAWVGIGHAEAADCLKGSPNERLCETRAEAHSSCLARATDYQAPVKCELYPADNYSLYYQASHGGWIFSEGYWSWLVECSVGSTWNDATRTCFDPSECLAHNAEPGFLNAGAVSKGFSETCSGGCQYKMQPGTGGCTTVGGVGGGAKLCFGEFEFTGNACALPSSPAPPEPLPNKPQECIPVSGQSVCVKPDGKICYSGAIGTPMQFCWNPGETGEQSNGDQQQQRDAGPDPQPPRQQPTTPETLGDPTPSITTTTTTSSGVTITTTTTTRTTGNGTTPPGRPGGQPIGPDGQPLDGDGEEGEDGTSTGGDTCSSAPTGAGGDPLLHAVILQAWRIRCPHGDNPLPSAEDASGQSGGGEHPSVDSLFTTVGGDGVQADDAGFGLPRSCPALDLPEFVLRGQTILMPWMTMCGWLDILAGMVVLVAYMQFAYIVANSLRGG